MDTEEHVDHAEGKKHVAKLVRKDPLWISMGLNRKSRAYPYQQQTHGCKDDGDHDEMVGTSWY